MLHVSEVLGDFKILLDSRAVYSGRAVVASLVQTGTTLVCEASLDENCLDARVLGGVSDPGRLRAGFEEFLHEWGKGTGSPPNSR